MSDSSTYITRYSQIRPTGGRASARAAALTIASSLANAFGARRRLLERPRVQFLCLHHVFEDEAAPFARLLAALRQHFQLVPYSEAVERILTGRIDGPYLAISFDDGLKSCVRAARCMKDVGASGCFFVCPPAIGLTDFAAAAEFCRDGLRQPPYEFMTWDDVESLQRDGHEIGAHTMRHPDLGRCSVQRLAEEMGGSREALRRRLGSCEHFAWPFGRWPNFSRDAVAASHAAGFRSTASAVRGCHTAPLADGPGTLCLRRDHVVAAWPIAHVLHFLSRAAGSSGPDSNLWPPEWRTADPDGEE